MGRISYLLKRLGKLDYRRMWATASQLRAGAGKGRAWLLSDMLRCAVRYNAGYMDYKIAQMYRLNEAQRRSVITRGINNRLVHDLNDKAYWHVFDDKSEFNAAFAKWVQRDWLRADKSLTREALRRFLEGKGSVFAKPLEGSSGQGILRFSSPDWETGESFFQKVRSMGDAILEETVVQHPKMAELHPDSVNTVRIATILGTKAEGIVYAFLRIGNGKVMDNVDTGGMAARVDLGSGKLMTPAADKQGNVYEKHPLTGTVVRGFQLPYFEEAKDLCLEAMRVVPQVRYIAWDVALTAAGPTLIEGNSFPSHAVPQFAAHYPDGIGILPEFSKFVDL